MRPDILTASGKYFDFLNPERSEILLEDIAHGLSNTCRFAGQCKPFYSVAEHSVRVARILPPHLQWQGLMHDAAEAYMGDVTSPLKTMLPDYKVIEKRVEAAIFAKFGLPVLMAPEVKQADLVLCATEQRDLMPPHDDQWAQLAGIEALEARIKPWNPLVAKSTWLWCARRGAGVTLTAPLAELLEKSNRIDGGFAEQIEHLLEMVRDK